ncbi:MAG: site-2 protease family protein, partial [Candidatus Micrarchaeia archaeon]
MVDRRVVEFLHIAVSVLVVSAAFAYGSESFVSDFFLIVVAVGTGFVLHELAHRFVAISYGAKASYHAWGFGLAMAVVLALVTGGAFVFAAPGAVVIYGAHRLSTEKYGKVALSGPLTNF